MAPGCGESDITYQPWDIIPTKAQSGLTLKTKENRDPMFNLNYSNEEKGRETPQLAAGRMSL